MIDVSSSKPILEPNANSDRLSSSDVTNADVKNLSSNRLGYIIRMSNMKHVVVDKLLIDKIRNELVRRGDYEAEINRRSPH